eukprot:gnl/MRDRNA2_/MRDRNA2_96557_c0_seq1.p1 gnl/MRDRNA2_/MRDRNA2_96557_c0~~gnl/MRDRNA2_/MRDRNA2_96557_c0_seq1.p1  ORF type:complete len:882 (+),score=182.96 gnl/MRDRNA2_/MRDRNA2_96557_c0_seq1:67-2712(+)
MGRSGSVGRVSISMQERRRSSIHMDILASRPSEKADGEINMEVLATGAELHQSAIEIEEPSRPRGVARLPHELLIADLETYLEHEREYTLAACEFGCRYLDAHVEDYTLATAVACRLAMAHGLTDLAAMQHLAEVSRVVAPNDSLKQRLHDARQAVLRDFDDLKELCDNVDPVMSDQLEAISDQTPLIAFVPLNGCNNEAVHFAHRKLKDKIRGRLLKIHKMTNANACPCCGAMLLGLKRGRSGEGDAGDGSQGDAKPKENAALIKELEAKLAACEEELSKERSKAEKLESEAKKSGNMQKQLNALEGKLAQVDGELKGETQKRKAISQHLVTCLEAGGAKNLNPEALSTGPSLDKLISGHCELVSQLFAEAGRESPQGTAISSGTPKTSMKDQLATALAEIENLKNQLASTMSALEVSSKRTQVLEAHLRSLGEEVPDGSTTIESLTMAGGDATSKGTGNTAADLRAARQRIQLLESRLRELGAEVPGGSFVSGDDDDADLRTQLEKERQKTREADSSVHLLRKENQRLQKELTDLQLMLEELQAKAQGMQKLSIKKGVGDEVRHLMEESGLDVLTNAPPGKGCRAVFARLYKDALERTKRLAIMHQNWREADEAQRLAVLDAFSKSVEQIDPNTPGSYLDVDCLCQMVTESLGKRGPASGKARSAGSASMEKAVSETFLKRPVDLTITSHPRPLPESVPELRECLRAVQCQIPGSSIPGTVFRSTRPATAGAVMPTGGGGPGISREGTIISSSGAKDRPATATLPIPKSRPLSKDRPMTASLPQCLSQMVGEPDSPGRRHLIAHIPSVGRTRTSSSLSGGSSSAQFDTMRRDHSPFRGKKGDLFQNTSLNSRPASGKENFAASFIVHGNMPRRQSATNL